jgi:hypothetical protein
MGTVGVDDKLIGGAVDVGLLGPGGDPSFREETLSSAASMMDRSLFDEKSAMREDHSHARLCSRHVQGQFET